MSEEGTAATNPSLRNAEFKKPANSTAIQRICRICWSGLIREALVARGKEQGIGDIKKGERGTGERKGEGECLDQSGYELLCL